MTPNEAARALLTSLSLPYGTVSIFAYHENGAVVMRVLVDKDFIKIIKAPRIFEGYEVKIEERQTASAYSYH